ncbi:hypothetical protein [Myceligenerans crystallogenes]|uniref:Uncharacterized protein n=1 Tax=Myceligenerans crystallogenes TaxID=316335 RepID=A0ABN2NIC1_9MICO
MANTQVARRSRPRGAMLSPPLRKLVLTALTLAMWIAVAKPWGTVRRRSHAPGNPPGER